MDDKILVLRALNPNQFGLKPTKGELVVNLVANFRLHNERAHEAISACLHDGLIEIDNIAHRISVTKEGLDYLDEHKKPKNTTIAATIPNEPDIKPQKKSSGKVLFRWLTILALIGGILGGIWYALDLGHRFVTFYHRVK